MFAVTNELMSDVGVRLCVFTNKTTEVPADAVVGPFYTVGVTVDNPNYSINIKNSDSGTPPALSTFTITNAVLKFVVNNKSRPYGDPDNGSLSGDVKAAKSDGTLYNNLDGISMALYCSATNTSPVGPYLINSQILDPNHRTFNYLIDYSQAVGTLTVAPATLTVAARNYTLRPGQAAPVYTNDAPTGFKLNQETNIAMYVTTMPTWTSTYNPATATIGQTFLITKATDGVAPNYTFSYVNGLVTVSTNRAPIPLNDSIVVGQGQVAKILINKLLANDFSPFGDPLTLISFDTLSLRHVPIGTDVTPIKLWLYYNTDGRQLDTNGVDSFTYTVQDSVLGTGKGTVIVKVVVPNTNYIPRNIAAQSYNAVNNSVTLTFVGIEGRKYKVQGTENVISGPWADLTLVDRNVNTAEPDINTPRTNSFICVNAAIKVTDMDAANFGNRFYRALVQPKE